MSRNAEFNFAAAAARTPLISWLLLLAGALAGALSAERHAAIGEEHESLARQAGRLERRSAPAPARHAAARNSAPAERRGDAAFPWENALREIELAIDPRIALLGLDTETASARTRLDGEARDIGDILAFAERLRASPLARRVLLAAHETRQAPSGAILGFTLQIDWDAE